MVKAVFEKQPPSNLRKSNFFHFVLSLYDKNNNAIETDKGDFIGFVKEDPEEESPRRNGIHYRLSLAYANGKYNLKIKQNFLIIYVTFTSHFSYKSSVTVVKASERQKILELYF